MWQQLRIAQAQAAAARAQAAAVAVAVPVVTPAAVQTIPTPAAPVSPAQPEVDLTPQQDAAQESAEGSGEAPASTEPKKRHWLLWGGILAVAGVGGYMVLKKRKKKLAAAKD